MAVKKRLPSRPYLGGGDWQRLSGRLAMHAIVLIENWCSVDHTERHNFAATVAPIAHNTVGAQTR